MTGSVQLFSNGIRPSINISSGNTFSKKLQGFLTFHLGYIAALDPAYDLALLAEEEVSSVSSMMVYNSKNYNAMVSLQFGIPQSYFLLSVTRKLENGKHLQFYSMKFPLFHIDGATIFVVNNAHTIA